MNPRGVSEVHHRGHSQPLIATGSLWSPKFGWWVCLPFAVYCGVTLVLVFLRAPLWLAFLPISGAVLALVGFGKVSVSRTRFDRSYVEYRTMFGQSRRFAYDDISRIRFYKNGLLLWAGNRRIKVYADEALLQRIKALLQQNIPAERLSSSDSSLFNTWQGSLTER